MPDDAGDDALRDDGWNEQARDETPMQRLDRNWADLLQELRVVQTGVQLLTGFLLTLPFQARFEQLSANERTIYLVTVALSVAITGATLFTIRSNVVVAGTPSLSVAVIVTVWLSSGPSVVSNDQLQVPAASFLVTAPTEEVMVTVLLP